MEALNQELNIYSEEVKDVLSTPPRALFRWGNTILLIFIVIILFLSWLIKYPDIISAQAIVTTEIPPQKEYARVTGKIKSLFVENYQEVKEGTHLALIENTANYKDVIYLKSILDTLKVSSSNFYFPLDSLPMLFLGTIETEFSLFENSYVQYILNKESQSFVNNDLTNNYALLQLKYRLQILNNQKDLHKEELLFKQKDLGRSETLFNKGIISAQEFENKKLEYLQSERSYKNMNVNISQIKENISNTSNLKKQTSIKNTREEINLLKNVIQSLDQLKRAVKEWELRYLFTSNIAGKVSFMKIWNTNQIINSEDFVFTIIPKDHSSYVCKVQAPALNSGEIKIGQHVNVKLNNYPNNEYGVLKGRVKNISLVPNAEGLYLLDVTLPETLVTTYNVDIEFKQEMSGIAEIITEDLRLIERVFYQFKDVFEQ
ncbi:HlyD family secretion protein [Olleya sp. Bg11-27]|uniref:HlyD family secretion protein n=1 Tax=Olleya sp. Bg11-27 TaxID=2058135 RepID=UPI000C309E02|nr:HlyD family efflux transporter periplasmic adaptor subunit [Olleya sp. Bg11-27]AUC76477.1 HlyD family secretion protein [Olleya sp. Bg11-27]